MVQRVDDSPIEKVEQLSPPSWSPRIVHIRATISGLSSALITFAILKSDPLPDFQRYIETTRHSFEDEHRALLAIQEAWNKPFASLRSDQLFFLYAWSAVPGASPKVVDIAHLTFGIATPGNDYKRWLTTSTVMRQGEPVAWCHEVDMLDTGQSQAAEIVLSEESMIRLPVMELS